MKKIYSIFFSLFILNLHIYIKNIKCNDLINYNDSNLRNGLLTNSLDATNGLNNKDNSFIDSKIEEHENNSYQNKDNNISIVGQDVPTTSVASSKIINANDLEGNSIDNTKGLSVTNSGFDDGSAFGGGLPLSGYSPLQGNHNKCPSENFCEGIKNALSCPEKHFTGRNGDWISVAVKESSTTNKGVLVPPRRRKLCLRNITHIWYRINDEKNFKEKFFKDALGESNALIKYYKEKNLNPLTAIKYGFSDMGDIIKGTDLIDYQITKNINRALDKILGNERSNAEIKNRVDWWEANKSELWDALMCGYKIHIGNKACPEHDNMDRIPQYLRWFREWGTYVCSEYKNKFENVIKLCNIQQITNQDDSQLLGLSNDDKCKDALKHYEEWINRRRPEWKGQCDKFEKEKNKYEDTKSITAEKYLKEICSECDCKYKDLDNTFKEFKDKVTLLKAVIENKKNQDSLTTTSQGNSHRETVVQQPDRTNILDNVNAVTQRGNNNHNNNLERGLGHGALPGTNIITEEKKLLEFINLTSKDEEDITKHNEDVREEIEEQQEEIEEDEEELENEGEEQQEEIEEDEEELENEGEETKEEDDEEKNETNDTEDIEEENKEKGLSNQKQSEEKSISKVDEDSYRILSVSYKDNNEVKNVPESIVKKLFSLFNDNNNLETIFKGLTEDMTNLFQK
ncbi:duffy binding-like merozoite surface protein [Plasmodium reichenowi]|uniref:Duffy binding-like merozoite surface protein n=2 Tax=Plasmodium reichenowi TaxID=5854 RepID=A0A060RZ60_PLARE|nr:duffy binding-like merozoite surface protein [Plasmodium reichenowi]